MSNMNPVLPTDAAPPLKLPTIAEKVSYVSANFEAVYAVAVASGLIHDGGRQMGSYGETLVMLNFGGWMTADGATRAGIFDHLIPDDLVSSPVLPAAILERLPTIGAPAPKVTAKASADAAPSA